MANEAREKIIKITRRTDVNWKNKTAVTSIALVVAFFVCSLLMLIVAPNEYGNYYVYFYKDTFMNFERILTNLCEAAFLFLIAVALTPVFKMKYWNIGAEGQCLMGALGSLIAMYFFAPHLPLFIAILLELLFGIVFAVAWAVIPAIFKAFFNANETLFTLMMNYIAYGIVIAFVKANQNDGQGNIVTLYSEEKYGWLPIIDAFKNSYLIIIILVILVSALVMVYMKYSKHGYELSVVGGSQNTAKYIGINVKKIIIRTVILTGVICGIVGFLCIAGKERRIDENIIGGNGFTAIIICWLGNFSVPLMGFYACLITFVSKGCSNAIDWGASNSTGVTVSGMKNVSVGLFFLIMIISTFFIHFKVKINLPKKKQAEVIEEGGQNNG